MKKIFIMFLFLSFVLTGCGKYNQKGIVKELNKRFDKSSGYKIEGDLSVNNNDEIYNYNIDVCFKKKDYYKVTLTNTANQHQQVILKNDDGVYVITLRSLQQKLI